MKYAIKVVDKNGNWQAVSIQMAKDYLTDSRGWRNAYFNPKGNPCFCWYHGEGEPFSSIQEVIRLCKCLNNTDFAGNFKPINKARCILLRGRVDTVDDPIRAIREKHHNKHGVLQKETKFERLRRESRESRRK